ncbi:hypothetical protein SAMN05421852_11943 [Thermoflavimicrobium dichotomicum]|uniref:Uncharacterized protein n=1 Tax=Thermoflavimicrobium dichotomicum TaxID=46223 RepID=A0A1I3TRZ9_9BACL|nr:hypothetical protein SAMN05421852_11943 [Thermoflavimicrobium dichotomicum]
MVCAEGEKVSEARNRSSKIAQGYPSPWMAGGIMR